MSRFLLLAMYISETTKVFGVYIKQHCKGWNRLKHSLLIFEIFNCFKTGANYFSQSNQSYLDKIHIHVRIKHGKFSQNLDNQRI